MGTLFVEYQQLILQAYEQKKGNGTLPHGLKHLSPARLRDECVMRCGENLSKRDEKVIRDFCGEASASKTYQAIIQHCDIDKFRPLVNFLNGRSESTAAKNIELLAWLIDFPGRPWELGKTYSNDTREILALADPNPVADDPEAGANSPTNRHTNKIDSPAENPTMRGLSDGPNRKESVETNNPEKLKGKSTKGVVAAVMLSLVLGTGGMWWWMDKNPPLGSSGCMYWIDDHYEPVACNQKIPNARVIALDTVKLKNFKKITVPDTITYQAKGNVWYSKIDGKIEFYTSGGEHPVIFGHQLKPITNYMIDKYIRPGMMAR